MEELNVNVFLLLGSMAAGFLYGLLGVLLYRRPWKSLEQRLAAGLAWSMVAFSIFEIATLLHTAIEAAGNLNAAFLVWLVWLEWLSFAIAAGLLWILCSVWLQGPRWLQWGGILIAVPIGILALEGNLEWSGRLVGLALAVAAAASLLASRPRFAPQPAIRRFRVLFAMALLVSLAGAAAPPESPLPTIGLLAPILCTLFFVRRYNLFDVMIARRLILLTALALGSSMYLLVVKVIVLFAEANLEWLSTVLEPILIVAAGLLWLPLLGWMFRSLTRRDRRFTEQNTLIIQQAVGIIDLEQRIHFLSRRLEEQYGLRRVVIQLLDQDKRIQAGAPVPAAGVRAEQAAALLEKGRPDFAHVTNSPDPELRQLLAKAGFNYLYPLWYDVTHLAGLLWVDSSPHLFLDDLDRAVVAFAREAAHSLEACRLIQDKIELEKALVRQEHLATLGKVAATIAHEVKNPLSSIKTLAQLMREDADTEKRYGQDLRFIVGETDRLNNCVQQLLTFSRPLPAGSTEFSLSEMLNDVVNALGREYAAQQVAIKPRIDPDLHLKGPDRQSLQQIVLNLAINALQASSPGESVRLEAHREAGSSVRISVSDEGPGIPSELQEKIFEPFFTTKQKGTGLGLAIVRKNVKHLRGDLELCSPLADGRGTRVTVTLPLEVPA
ncbi:MAG: ATP-binding protein [Bryobacteraceae bacterium]